MDEDVYIYTDTTGVITVDTSVIQTQVETEYQNVFGSDLLVTPNTPQGMLITTDVIARNSVADNNAQIANQINPNLAGGVWLDALMALLGSYRIPGSYSLVYATISGVPGTVIPASSQASETTNNAIFATTTQVTIPAEGTLANVEFQSILFGPIPVAASTLTQIISNILGWETVTNPAAGTPGTLEQSDTSARASRQQTLATQGTGTAQAIISALYLTPGVTSLKFQENISDDPATINGVLMSPHSLYTCVAGTASTTAIAQTLTNTKDGGCNYNNGLGVPQSVTITNQYSGQPIDVLFDTPSTVNISMQITVGALTTVQDVTTAVQNAVLAYAAGTIPFMPGFVVGGNVSPFNISAAIAQQIPGISVQEVEIGVVSFTQQGTLSSGVATITGMTYTSALSMGLQVAGTGIPSSTIISSVDSSSQITLSHNATTSGKQILTFTQSVVLQTTEIPIDVWQQAATQATYITVMIA